MKVVSEKSVDVCSKITPGSNNNVKDGFHSGKVHQRARVPFSSVISFNNKGRADPRYVDDVSQNEEKKKTLIRSES